MIVFDAIGGVEFRYHDLTLPPALDLFRRNSESGGVLAKQEHGEGQRPIQESWIRTTDAHNN